MINSEPSFSQLFDLSGRVAVVTGGTGLLGAPMSRALAEAGAAVVITSRSKERAQTTVQSLPSRGGAKHHAVEMDQTESASIEQAFSEVVKSAGCIDILVNNAVEQMYEDWITVTAEQFNRQLTNLTGYFLLSRLVRNHAVQRKAPANIIMLGSIYGVVTSYPDVYEGIRPATPVAYQVMKAGVIQMVRHLGVYWARDGVRVNCLTPGPFPVPSLDVQTPAKIEKPELIKRLCQKSPMKRMGIPHEMKGAVVFLASDASSYMTGQNLIIDGGWVAC